jgi:hypothetical protein
LATWKEAVNSFSNADSKEMDMMPCQLDSSK